MQYSNQLAIAPLAKPPQASVRVPGSKSITNRALVMAALTASTEFDSVLQGALKCEDTEVMIESLRRLGFEIVADWDKPEIRLRKPKKSRGWFSDSIIPASGADLFVA